ncbi:MAG: response regulator transcription factor [Myxococcales bacterium]|nr:response regulator transcription factor [Myxococcales bacterium]MCB9708408.1 response regulator transcription factor [Myxococcales bacterium]
MWVLVVGSKRSLERAESGAWILRQLGCTVRTADLWDSADVLEQAQQPPAAVLIEALDDVDAGRAAMGRLRAVPSLGNVPILMAITVNAIQRVQAHDGLDDIVLVPYVPAELYMRIRLLEWRRSEFSGQEILKVGMLTLDLAGHELSVRGRLVPLTQQEFALLRHLCEHRGRVFSREQLLKRVWGVDYYGGSRTVDIHVRRLRVKLGDSAEHIETVRGVGYKIKAPSP